MFHWTFANFDNVYNSILTIANFASLILLLFFERKKPEAALSWMLVILFVPLFGIILYILFGQTITARMRARIRRKPRFDKALNQALYEQLDFLNHDSYQLKDTNMQKYVDLIRLNLNQNASLYSQDNVVKVFTSAQEKYEQLLEDIANAQHSINILYFIIRNDNIGRKIVATLTEKAKAGVKVRLCYDEVGSFLTSPRLFHALKKAGGKVIKFSPSFLFIKTQPNFRNHRKIVVIDGDIGYVGGINIGDEYMGLKRLKPWRDTHLRIVGSSVMMLQLRFFLDWLYINDDEEISDFSESELQEFFHMNPKEGKGTVGVQIVSSGPDAFEDEIKNGYMKMINSAKQHVYIQTPYFVPDDAFLHSVKIAALSGVDVRVMIPGTPDKKLIYLGTLSYVADLLEYGVKVYTYPGFLHAKMIVIDHEVTSIGTTNFDVRSFALNYEINAFLFDTNLGIKCAKIFEEDMALCTEITKADYAKMPKVKKLLCGIMRLFTPMI